MTNLEIAKAFLDWFGNNYDQLSLKYKKFCSNKRYTYDEDIFANLPIKIYDLIIKKGISDTSEQGFDGYTFMSFKNNLLNERRYSRVNKRDENKTDIEINELYENWYNKTKSSADEKLLHDLYIDFSTLYILLFVEANFDSEHYYLFRLKVLNNLTFKQLQEKTQIQYSRKKFLEVNNWLKANLKKADIRKAFEEQFGNLFA